MVSLVVAAPTGVTSSIAPPKKNLLPSHSPPITHVSHIIPQPMLTRFKGDKGMNHPRGETPINGWPRRQSF